MIISSVLGIASVCFMGIGVSSGLKAFHNFEFNFKPKGGIKDGNSESQSLRERAKGLS
ncbi:DUF7394 family protein [Rossellomorea marisflavi]|uniref:DUF7394 family protein n=1 Tax=Rossellomorea marisflavi TaxID=189381 RepID=UPI003CEFEFDA